MYDFHLDRYAYFKTQVVNTERHVIPFIASSGVAIGGKVKVLEIGCAEGGVMKAFVDKGCRAVGVEINGVRFGQASAYLKDELAHGRISLYHNNIFDNHFRELFENEFDLIVLKDVIEHIHGQEELLVQLRSYLKTNGHIFIGFPPWSMPFGGHQQISSNKWISRIPWIHLLPRWLYKWILVTFDKNPNVATDLMEIRETRIDISRFERIAREAGYTIKGKEHFLFNPIYEYKFGIRGRRQLGLISQIPYLRDYLTTCVYYVIQKNGIGYLPK